MLTFGWNARVITLKFEGGVEGPASKHLARKGSFLLLAIETNRSRSNGLDTTLAILRDSRHPMASKNALRCSTSDLPQLGTAATEKVNDDCSPE